MLTLYFIGVALGLVWGEWQVSQRQGTHAEQLVFSLTWPVLFVGTVLFGVSCWLCDFSEAVDRWFDEWNL